MITQGEWRLNDNDGIVYGGMEREICQIPHDEDEDLDNAALIAAAPKLLKLAEQYRDDVETRLEELNNQDDMGMGEYGDEIAHWTATLKQIKLHIREAENK